MSKTTITADMLDDKNSPLLGAVILDGDDRPQVSTVYENVEDAQTVKSLRLPTALYNKAVAAQHPNGFSGVVRDALAAYLDEPGEADVQHALEVITRAVSHPRAA